MVNHRRVFSGAAAAAVALFVALAGCEAPTPQQDKPAQKVAPRKVLLEIDRMAGTPAIRLEQAIKGKTVSLKAIYAEAGIDLDVREDQIDLPHQDVVSLA